MPETPVVTRSLLDYVDAVADPVPPEAAPDHDAQRRRFGRGVEQEIRLAWERGRRSLGDPIEAFERGREDAFTL